jgi:hypothetical protein
MTPGQWFCMVWVGLIPLGILWILWHQAGEDKRDWDEVVLVYGMPLLFWPLLEVAAPFYGFWRMARHLRRPKHPRQSDNPYREAP